MGAAAASCEGRGGTDLSAGFLPGSTGAVLAWAVPLTARGGGCAAKYSAAAARAAARRSRARRGRRPARRSRSGGRRRRLPPRRRAGARLHRRLLPAARRRPADFGAIAATNALNDVFAMGGVPLLALSIAAFPEELPVEVLGDVLAGGRRAGRAAGAILAGGHTIRDSEPKYGLAVIGTVHPDALWTKARARAGRRALPDEAARHRDRPQAHRDGMAPDAALDAAVDAMRELDRDARTRFGRSSRTRSRTSPGFGLLGHVHEVADRSGVRAISTPGAARATGRARARARRRAHRRRSEQPRLRGGRTSRAAPTRHARRSRFDPQTAGGLLVSLPAERGACSKRRSRPRALALRASAGSRPAAVVLA